MEYCESASREHGGNSLLNQAGSVHLEKCTRKHLHTKQRNSPRLLMSFGKPLDDPSKPYAPKTGISGRAPSTVGA